MSLTDHVSKPNQTIGTRLSESEDSPKFWLEVGTGLTLRDAENVLVDGTLRDSERAILGNG